MILLSEVLPIRLVLSKTSDRCNERTLHRTISTTKNRQRIAAGFDFYEFEESQARTRANPQAASFVASARTRVEPSRVALTTFISCQS